MHKKTNNRYKRTWPFEQKGPFVMDKEKVGLLGMRLQKLRDWGEHDGVMDLPLWASSWSQMVQSDEAKASLKAHDSHVLCGYSGSMGIWWFVQTPIRKGGPTSAWIYGHMLVKDVPSIEHGKNITTGVVRAVALLEAMFLQSSWTTNGTTSLYCSDLPTWVNLCGHMNASTDSYLVALQIRHIKSHPCRKLQVFSSCDA